jgi:heat shock protein HtpX
MFKTVFLLGITNVLVVATLVILVNVLSYFFGIPIDLSSYTGLILMALVMGFGGSFISLLMSKAMAKRMPGMTVIDPNTRDASERWLLDTVHRVARQAGMEKMPEVCYYQSADPNAFATGPSKDNSLVAVSTGLMDAMDKGEVEGVLAHEVSHITNGDMVTMTLIQGVINTFVIAVSWLLANILANAMRSNDDREGGGSSFFMQHMLVSVLQIPLSLLGMLVVNAFSRWREFHADSGSAHLVGREKMIAALQALQRVTERPLRVPESQKTPESMRAMMISGGIGSLFATHPPLEARIEALRQGKYIK